MKKKVEKEKNEVVFVKENLLGFNITRTKDTQRNRRFVKEKNKWREERKKETKKERNK